VLSAGATTKKKSKKSSGPVGGARTAVPRRKRAAPVAKKAPQTKKKGPTRGSGGKKAPRKTSAVGKTSKRVAQRSSKAPTRKPVSSTKPTRNKRARASRARSRGGPRSWVGKGRQWMRASIRRWVGRLAVLSLVGVVVLATWLDVQVRAQFEGKRWTVPAVLYARSLELYREQVLSKANLVRELEASGYQAGTRLSRPGTFSVAENKVEIRTREFDFWDGVETPRRLTVGLRDGRVESLRDRRGAVALARLEPAVIGRIYPHHAEDRVLVQLESVPQVLKEALLTSEDRDFWSHHGLSARSLARAGWANLLAGRTVQGGSTLTQQLAKNFFLTPERTLTRKVREAAIALILEARYDKEEILEAYLNEVYLGQHGKRAIHGFGLAARFYFGRPLQELRIAEIATLVALVRGASYYDPRRHPDRARARRDLILDLMAQQGYLSAAKVSLAKSQPLGVVAIPGPVNSAHPAFVDLVRRQLRRDYRDEDLRGEGLRIFTTLSPVAQREAELALAGALQDLTHRKSKRKLQGAVVVCAGDSAEVLAVVGGRQVRQAAFNRALDAIRPIGSLVKPAVFLAALEDDARLTLGSLVEDRPVAVTGPQGVWNPKNYDGKSHGPVPLHEALARSYNQATVRLGMQVGVGEVVATLQRLGIKRKVATYPSTLLGSLELSPLEVLQMYQTLSAGGFYMPLRAIREVTDASGKPLSKYSLAGSQVVTPQSAYLLRAGLERVVQAGTARYAAGRLRKGLSAGGKTGTSDGLRDSWFAGFAGNRVAAVWVGRDDNRPAGLSGSSGALRVWTRLFKSLPTANIAPPVPQGIVWAWTDPANGKPVEAGCRGAIKLPFRVATLPPLTSCGASAAATASNAMPHEERG